MCVGCGWVKGQCSIYHTFLPSSTINRHTSSFNPQSLMIPKHLGAFMSSRKPTNLVDRVTLAFIVIGSAAFFLAMLLYNSELCLP